MKREHLAPGDRLGPYEVIDALGAGGMGEVVRARDPRLGREVAIKRVAARFALDPERRARFEREARILASLDHPSLATIFGLEEVAGETCLVLEHIEGETLAACLARGPLRLDEAMTVAAQVADGLSAAHDAGVIHRDVKPSNVMLRPDGRVKILDFGIAKALVAAGDDEDQSSTLGGTSTGQILGTPGYLSPEQARGKHVDRRADVWGFGCLFYECLTGFRAFPGEHSSDRLTAVLHLDPDWALLPSDTPPRVRDLLRRCLEKDPRRRLRDLGDARLELEEAMAGHGVAPLGRRLTRGLVGRRARRGLVHAAIAAAAATGGALAWEALRPAARSTRPLRLGLHVEGQLSPRSFSDSIDISADAAVVTYRTDGTLHFRRLAEPRELGNTSLTADYPFLSPDGGWVAFMTATKLVTLSLTGGQPVELASAPRMCGGTWGRDGNIYFAPYLAGAIWRIPVSGGSATQVTELRREAGEVSHRWPAVFPDGSGLVYTVKTGVIDTFDDAVVRARSLRTGDDRVVIEHGTDGRLTASGHLVYARAGALYAAPFDAKRLALSGPTVQVLAGVVTNPITGRAQFAVSDDGTLLHIAGEVMSYDTVVERLDPAGGGRRLLGPAPFYEHAVSPDGTRLALVRREANDSIWVHDLASGMMRRLTGEPGNHHQPSWTPDGQRVSFSVDRGGDDDIYWMAADGSGPEEALLLAPGPQSNPAWSPDGKEVLYDHLAGSDTGCDIWVLPLDDRTPRPLVQARFPQMRARISPDGKWVAYESHESVSSVLVAVHSYPGLGERALLGDKEFGRSANHPRWSADSRTLYFSANGNVEAVEVKSVKHLELVARRVVLDAARLQDVAAWEVAPDGAFIVVRLEAGPTPPSRRLQVWPGWFEELERLAPHTR